MKLRKPNVFISSTYYDLRQVRMDLLNFLEEDLGYRMLASEFSSFPVDPDINAIENCKKRVEEDADIFVLIIGNRYGSIPKGSSQSVTNLEYVTANLKRIPIYAFVMSDVLSILPVWKRNPEADFSDVVDNVELFKFVEEIRSQNLVWVSHFQAAQEIIEKLRIQFSYLMNRGLQVQSQLSINEKQYTGLSGNAFRLAIEKPSGWQGLLLCELLEDEIEKNQDLKIAYDKNITFGEGVPVEEDSFAAWNRTLLSEAQRMIKALERLISEIMNNALSSKDIELIAYSARELGNAYRAALEWAIRVRKVYMAEKFHSYQFEVSLMLDDYISKIESFSKKLRPLISEALADLGSEDITLPFTLEILLANTERVDHELANLKF